jgi:hypothetical protein
MIHPAAAAQKIQTSQPEIWESQYLFTRSEAHINKDKDKIWGVLYLHGLFGKVDTYHFKGTLVDGKIKAAHYRGHKFEGRMVSRDKVVGVLTSRQGMKFNVTSHRRKD